MDSTTSPCSFQLPLDVPFAFSLHALAAHLQTVPDRRHARGKRYPLAPLLTLGLLAKLAGYSRLEAVAAWATLRAADLTRPTMPHPSTWSRVLGEAVDPAALERALSTFFQTPPTSESPARGSIVMVVDGKTIRGTIPVGQTQGVHLVAVYLPAAGVMLAQLAVEQKVNEIVVVPTLLAQLDLRGRVVVGDAMQTQRNLSTQIVEAGGDYLWFGCPVGEGEPTDLAGRHRGALRAAPDHARA